MNTNKVVLILMLAGAAGLAVSQPGAIRRIVIQKADVSVPGREAVVAKVEVDAGGSSGRHTHPGDEIAYILEGEGELLVEGEDPRRIKAGESYVIPAGTIHDAINSGKTPLRLVGVYVVDKGKPLATPAK